MGQVDYKSCVGDRIINVSRAGSANPGKLGTIIKKLNNDCLIEFDDFMNGHSGDGKGKNGHCWWMFDGNFTVIPQEWDK